MAVAVEFVDPGISIQPFSFMERGVVVNQMFRWCLNGFDKSDLLLSAYRLKTCLGYRLFLLVIAPEGGKVHRVDSDYHNKVNLDKGPRANLYTNSASLAIIRPRGFVREGARTRPPTRPLEHVWLKHSSHFAEYQRQGLDYKH